MNEYSKIQSIFKRDEKTHKFIEGRWSLPEFEYLQNNEWVFTEKIDGTNIRIIWDNWDVSFKGRTDKAQIYEPLFAKLKEIFIPEKLTPIFDGPVCLYGEGYGARIQKGGGNYRSDVGFILFDVKVGNWWLKREDLEGVAEQLEIPIVPIIGYGTLHEAILAIKSKVTSTFGDFLAEGLVLKPKVELKARNLQRIMTKVKHKDFL